MDTYSNINLEAELTSNEKNHWFHRNENAVSFYIDKFNYSVFIKEHTQGSEGIKQFLNDLKLRREAIKLGESNDDKYFDLSISTSAKTLYGNLYLNGLQSKNEFDIYILSYIPAKNIPIIQVQLHKNSIIEKGIYYTLERSYQKIKEILLSYNIDITETKETEIDFDFQTNIISDISVIKDLNKHLVGQLDHCEINKDTKTLLEDQITLYSTAKNTVKLIISYRVEEIIKENKAFYLFDYLCNMGIISKYDAFVYNKAYLTKSFKKGIIIGRIDWYLEYGCDNSLKEFLRKIKENYCIKNENYSYAQNKIDEVLPSTMSFLNLKFETRYKFYEKEVNSLIKKYTLKQKENYHELERLYKILELRPEIFKLLFMKISFVQNNKNSNSREMSFWKAIRSKIETFIF